MSFVKWFSKRTSRPTYKTHAPSLSESFTYHWGSSVDLSSQYIICKSCVCEPCSRFKSGDQLPFVRNIHSTQHPVVQRNTTLTCQVTTIGPCRNQCEPTSFRQSTKRPRHHACYQFKIHRLSGSPSVGVFSLMILSFVGFGISAAAASP